MLGGALRPEEVHLRAEGEDEVVVGERLETLEPDFLRLEVDPGDRSLVDRRVLLVLHEVAKRVPDGGRLEQARRELVQERLERVVVVLVDEDDLDVCVLQLPRSADPGEAATENEDARPRVRACRKAHLGAAFQTPGEISTRITALSPG